MPPLHLSLKSLKNRRYERHTQLKNAKLGAILKLISPNSYISKVISPNFSSHLTISSSRLLNFRKMWVDKMQCCKFRLCAIAKVNVKLIITYRITLIVIIVVILSLILGWVPLKFCTDWGRQLVWGHSYTSQVFNLCWDVSGRMAFFCQKGS